MKAIINKIIPFSNVDGPGNRMAIFVQGCPFKCLYCHNPETINICSNCGKCVSHCPNNALSFIDNKVIYDKNKCINCDTCIHICPNLSSPKTIVMDEEQLYSIIVQAKPFIRGITISGGECTDYAPFLLELFKKVKKEGLTCLLDSNGCHSFKDMEELLSISDGVMLDVKAFDNEFHSYLTGKSNEIVLDNLRYLLERNKLVEVRTVILPNKDKENENTVREVSKIIKSRVKYKLIKYRFFGVRKEGLDVFNKTIVSDEVIQKYIAIAKEEGCNSTTTI